MAYSPTPKSFAGPLPEYITARALDEFIETALAEDVGDGDHSTLSAVPEDSWKRARLLVKDDGILAGVLLAERIFDHVDARLRVKIYRYDKSQVQRGDVAFSVEGPARSILTAERLVLNCMQRMSAIATRTHGLNQLIAGTSAQLLDTRKTTPNFRMLEKWAVSIGGGRNHRFGLFDMIMLKDNHIDYAGGVRPAIEAAHRYLNERDLRIKIVIETRNLLEVREVLASPPVNRIMLDNMSPDEMREAVALIGDYCATEATGGITEETIGDIAATGVDYISVGALTHSVRGFDLSLKAY